MVLVKMIVVMVKMIMTSNDKVVMESLNTC